MVVIFGHSAKSKYPRGFVKGNQYTHKIKKNVYKKIYEFLWKMQVPRIICTCLTTRRLPLVLCQLQLNKITAKSIREYLKYRGEKIVHIMVCSVVPQLEGSSHFLRHFNILNHKIKLIHK